MILDFLRRQSTDIAVLYEETLLTGRTNLYDLYAPGGDKCGLIAAAAALEKNSGGAYAFALTDAAEKLSLEVPECDDFAQVRARGVSGTIDGEKYFLGNKRWLRDNGIAIPDAARYARCGGYTVLYAAKNNEFIGMLLFCDELSQDAKAVMSHFYIKGIKTLLLGRKHTAFLTAKRLGIDEYKAAILKIEREKVLQELKNGDRIILLDSTENLQKYAISLPIDFAVRLEEEPMFGKVNYTMKITGMSCAHCSARVKSALESIRGVSAAISLEEKTARVKCPASLDAHKLTDAVTEAGFTVVSVDKV